MRWYFPLIIRHYLLGRSHQIRKLLENHELRTLNRWAAPINTKQYFVMFLLIWPSTTFPHVRRVRHADNFYSDGPYPMIPTPAERLAPTWQSLPSYRYQQQDSIPSSTHCVQPVQPVYVRQGIAYTIHSRIQLASWRQEDRIGNIESQDDKSPFLGADHEDKMKHETSVWLRCA